MQTSKRPKSKIPAAGNHEVGARHMIGFPGEEVTDS